MCLKIKSKNVLENSHTTQTNAICLEQQIYNSKDNVTQTLFVMFWSWPWSRPRPKALFQILASIIQSLTPRSYSLPCLQFWAPAPGPGSGPWLILYSWHDTRHQIVHISKGKSDIREISTLLTELQTLCPSHCDIFISYLQQHHQHPVFRALF